MAENGEASEEQEQKPVDEEDAIEIKREPPETVDEDAIEVKKEPIEPTETVADLAEDGIESEEKKEDEEERKDEDKIDTKDDEDKIKAEGIEIKDESDLIGEPLLSSTLADVAEGNNTALFRLNMIKLSQA